MKKILSFILLMFLFLGSTSISAQKTWVGSNNGNWNTNGNWSPNGVPGAGDNVIINTSVNINVNTNATINRLTVTGNASVSFTSNGAARTITVDNTGSSIDSGSSLELRGSNGSGTRTMTLAFTGTNRTMHIAGALNVTAVSAGGVYNAANSSTTVTGTLINSGGTITSTSSNLNISVNGIYQHDRNGGTIPTATWDLSSTCLVSGITNTIPSGGLGQSFGNFTWNCTSQSGAINNITGTGGGLTTVNGNFTVSSTNSRTLNLNNSSSSRTVNVEGDFVISGGNVDWTSGSGSTFINVGGNIDVTGAGTLTASTSNTSTVNGTFVLTGTNPQNLNFQTPANITYTNFTVNNGRTLVLTSNVILNRHNNAPWRGTITVNNGGTLNCGSYVIDGGGLVQTNAEFNLNSGGKIITANAAGIQGSVNITNVTATYSSGANYEFRGASTGVFVLTSANTITGTFTVNNSSGVTLNQNFTISTLEFLDGLATTGNFAITIPLTGSVSGAGSTKYVNGRLNKVFNSASNFTYPVGKDGVYKPLVFQFTSLSGTSTISVEQFESALTGTLPASINLNNARYWEISRSGGSSFSYKLTLDGSNDDITGNVVMLKKESGVITDHSVTSPDFTNVANFNTLTGTNQFTLGSSCTQVAATGVDQRFCEAVITVLSASQPVYGTGVWSVSGPSTSTAQFADINDPNTTFFPNGGNGEYILTWTITNGNCSDFADVKVEYGKISTWTAALGGSWSNGVPDETTSAVVAYDYTSSGDLTACSLTVTNNAEMLILSGDVVNLTGGLTVDSGSSFTLSHDAYLLQQGTANLNEGEITVKRQTQSLMRLDYVLWSSPVENQNLLSFSPLTVTNRFYTYNSATDVYSAIAPGSNDFLTAKGYLIRMPDNHPTSPTVWEGNFVGKPNSGDLTFTLSAAGNGYTAVGNPYPSPVSIATFLNDNNGLIDGNLYFWRKTNNALGSAYITCSGGVFSDGPHDHNNIQPGQGFFVRAVSAGNLQFNNLQRELNDGVFYRNDNAVTSSRIWLHLKSNNAVVGNMAIGYRADATNEIDQMLDGEYINDSTLALNSIVAETELAVQHRADFIPADVVPLSFKTNNAGSFEIAINVVDGLFLNEEQPIFLKDNLLQIEHDLRNASYSFVSDAGTFTSRFEVVYQSTLSIENPVAVNSVVVFSKDKNIQINTGSTTMSAVKVFDMRGSLVAQRSDVNASTVTIPLTQVENQVLIVQVSSADGQTVSKKVVH